MKYVKKIPPSDKELAKKLVSEGWIRLREPSNVAAATLFSVPFMLINGAVFIAITFYLYPPLRELLNSERGLGFTFTINLFSLIYIAGIFIFMALHEFTHACFIPGAFKSDKTYWGINGLFAFVFTEEKIQRGSFMIISFMPFFLLSVILPFILKIIGLLNGYTIFLCLINSMGACVDMLNMCLVGFQVPRGSYLLNNGFETYFKQISDR